MTLITILLVIIVFALLPDLFDLTLMLTILFVKWGGILAIISATAGAVTYGLVLLFESAFSEPSNPFAMVVVVLLLLAVLGVIIRFLGHLFISKINLRVMALSLVLITSLFAFLYVYHPHKLNFDTVYMDFVMSWVGCVGVVYVCGFYVVLFFKSIVWFFGNINYRRLIIDVKSWWGV